MKEITDSEVLIMKIIWNSEEPLSIQEIMNAVNSRYEKAWKVQTVSTFLSKLVKKKYLKMERKGRLFFYYPLVSEEAYGAAQIEQCVSFWGNGKLANLVASFTQRHHLSEAERQEIEELLGELDE